LEISRRTALIGLAAAAPLVMTMMEPETASAATAEPDAPTGVLGVQRWLNATFGGKDGWVAVAEDGVAGQATLAGLVQGLQDLLGISPLVPAFGPTTITRLEQHGGVGGETGPDAQKWRQLVQGREPLRPHVVGVEQQAEGLRLAVADDQEQRPVVTHRSTRPATTPA
jgi:hypothetical protein